jgi:hypothetical protein
VRDQLLAEADELRGQIDLLQREVAEKSACAVGMFKMAELGQRLRLHKCRLNLLEGCIAGLSHPELPTRGNRNRQPVAVELDGREFSS